MAKYCAAATAVAVLLSLGTASTAIARQDTPQTGGEVKERPVPQTGDRLRQRVFGWQLMTPEERAEYHNKMRSLKTAEEREQFRRQHHKLMKERAKAKGITLPDEPPMGRGGVGPRDGMGPGGGQGR